MKTPTALCILAASVAVSLGATDEAPWAPLGPFGGSALVVAGDPHSIKTFVAGTANSMLFRSTDAGATWTPLPFPAQLRAVLHTLVIDPQRPGIYLAGLSSESPQFSGMMRSTDFGATWQQVPGLRGRQVRAIAFWRGSSQVIAAGTETGVFESRDGGATWNRVSPEDNDQLQPIVALAFDPKDSRTIYAGTPHLPWKTVDGGDTWQSIHNGMLDDSDVFSIEVDRNRPQRVFASACSGIYRSLNGGASWTRLVHAKGAADRTYVIRQDPQYENIWFAGTSFGMMRSGDGGATWEKLGSLATHSIAFDLGHLGRILIATDNTGILRSEDNGKNWQSSNQGFCNRRLGSLSTPSRAVLYASTVDNGSAFRLTAGATDWEEITPEAPPAVPGAAAKPTVLLSPPWVPNLILAGTESEVYVSEDSGKIWHRIDFPSLSPGIRGLVALDPPWIAAIGTSEIFLSTDGRRWKPVSPPGRNGEFFDIVSTSQRSLVAATFSGLKISDDLGASWRPVRGELKENTIQALCRHPDRPSVLFAAKYGTIYTSPNSGNSWVKISPDDWPISSIKQLIIVPDIPDRLFVLTPQQGVFVLSLPSR